MLARVPWGIVFTALAIAGVGIVNLASAAQATRPNLYLLQLGYVFVAVVAAAFIARTRLYVLEGAAYPIYALVNILLVLVLVVGTTKKGATRWLDLGFFNLQPSELAKIAIVLVTARYFSRFRVIGGYTLRALFMPLNLSRPIGVLGILILRWMKQSREVAEAAEAAALGEVVEAVSTDPTSLKVLAVVVVLIWLALGVFVLVRRGFHHRRLIAPIDVVLVPWGLVVIEPDLGTSLIVAAIAAAQILFCGVRRWSLVIAFTAVGATAVFGWNFLLKDYQKRRVETFLNPEADIQGAGYHAAQSMIAIGSGQVTGKGLGQGTQTQLSFLPENHTDFVFSVLAEEWGLVGASTVILLFMTLVLLMLRDARKATDRFSALVNVGAAAMIFWHVLVNIGMVTGLMPVVGMTLPLMSYGGSSMLTMTVAIALAVNTRIWRR
jgi:rod shape determining protein RodA